MKALVTGATGFVGRHLIDTLLTRGDRVTALVRTPGKAGGFTERGVHIVQGDLGDPAGLRAAARGQDVIYHVAGVVSARNEAEFFAVNRDGAARVADAAAAGGAGRIVLVSSMAAGGPSERGRRLTGDEPPRPVTAYGRSKLGGEEAIRLGKLPWTILRPPAVYGPFDVELLRLFKAARVGIVPLFGDGAQELSFVYGPDLADALAAAGSTDATIGHTYYPCHPEILTSGSAAEIVGRAVGKKPRLLHLPRWTAEAALGIVSTVARFRQRATLLTPDKAHDFFAPAWIGDPAPLQRATGWSAQHDFSSGTIATAAWYRAAGWL